MKLNKTILLFLPLILLFLSCGKTVGDKTYNEATYELDFKQLYVDQTISDKDAFMINYSILRQRDYFGYDITGKTYGEILAMANSFQEKGLPIKEVFKESKMSDAIKATIIYDNDGSSFVREGTSKRVSKNIKFSCEFENVSDKRIALNFSTFAIKGPFNAHITTIGFENNCKINPGSKLVLKYYANAKVIKENLLYKSPRAMKRILIDELIKNVKIELIGLQVSTKNVHAYSDCTIDGKSVEAFESTKYDELYGGKDVPVKEVNGVVEINRGPSLFVKEESDEPIQGRF